MTTPLTTGYPHDEVGELTSPPVAASPRQLSQARRQDTREATLRAVRPEPPREASADRVCGAIVTLIAEADAANPGRDHTSDGTWGDSRHKSLGSATDHNPWLKVDGVGYVRAGDIDVDGLDLAGAFEQGRQYALTGRLPQVVNGGYFILNGKITAPDFSSWRRYLGADQHLTHGHVSASVEFARFDSRAPWGLFTPVPATAPTPGPGRPAGAGWTGPDATGRGITYRAQLRNNGQRVADVQSFLRRVFPAYAGGLDVDGWFGPQTAGVVAEFAARSGIRSADGLNIGPQIATALWRMGFDR